MSAITAVALVLSACGGEKVFRLPADADPGPIHVHGLGINPEDGSLLIATHTGLWQVAPDEQKVARVGELFQDTMGFTILGPDVFLGSGHPDVQQVREKNLPPHLGLIESRDAGRTWDSLSLLGEADFHVLRSVESRVYGFDASNMRLLLSRDSGRTWSERSLPGFPPDPLADLVADPTNPSHIVATTESALWESTDEGARWDPLRAVDGLLAWPSPDALFLVGGDGAVELSRDGGRQWDQRGEIGGQPAAFLAMNEEELYAALHDGTIKQSNDGGQTWRVRSTP